MKARAVRWLLAVICLISPMMVKAQTVEDVTNYQKEMLRQAQAAANDKVGGKWRGRQAKGRFRPNVWTPPT